MQKSASLSTTKVESWNAFPWNDCCHMYSHPINYRWMCFHVRNFLNSWNEGSTHSNAHTLTSNVRNIFRKVLQIIERIQLFVRLRLIYLKTIDNGKQLLPKWHQNQFPSFWQRSQPIMGRENGIKCFLFMCRWNGMGMRWCGIRERDAVA